MSKTYYQYRDVPLDTTYPSAWRQRGYKVQEGSLPVGRLITHFDGILSNLPLYSLLQVNRMPGMKAKKRRQVFLSALYGEEEEKP